MKTEIIWFLQEVLQYFRCHCAVEDLDLLNKVIGKLDRIFTVAVEVAVFERLEGEEELELSQSEIGFQFPQQ